MYIIHFAINFIFPHQIQFYYNSLKRINFYCKFQLRQVYEKIIMYLIKINYVLNKIFCTHKDN